MVKSNRIKFSQNTAYKYLIFYKPYNVIAQFTNPEPDRPRSTLKDFINVSGVYPVGRLDQDSEGLLLLTNDPVTQHHLTDPAFAHPKTYWVQVEGIANTAALQALGNGVTIRVKQASYHTRPALVRQLPVEPLLPARYPPIRDRANIPTSWLEITLTEGKNRQIRKMTAAVGLPTLRLVRVKIGELTLGKLQPGEWSFLNSCELKLNFGKNLG